MIFSSSLTLIDVQLQKDKIFTNKCCNSLPNYYLVAFQCNKVRFTENNLTFNIMFVYDRKEWSYTSVESELL